MNSKRVAITGIGGSASAKVIADVLEKGRQGLIIVPGRSRSEKLAEDLSFFCSRPIEVLPPDEELFIKYEAKNQDQEIERSRILRLIESQKDIVVVAPASGAIKKLPPKKLYENSSISIENGQVISLDSLKEKLASIGYERVDLVYGPGQFSVRGGILDVFSGGSDAPVRIEFFDDEVDGIRSFDLDTQRSIRQLNEIRIDPAGAALKGLMDEDRDFEYLWDYMESKDIFIEDPERIREHLELRYKELWNDLDYLVEKGQASKEEGVSITGPEDFDKVLEEDSLYFLQPFAKAIRGVDSLTELINANYHPATSYSGHMDILERDIKNYGGKGVKCILAAGSEARKESLENFLRDKDLEKYCQIRLGDLSTGMYFPQEGIAYISHRDIFENSKLKPRRKGKQRTKGKAIGSFTELKVGEYVVHDNYGIGIFQGIEPQKDAMGVRDYIKIKYQGKAILYVPVEKMDAVQKYIGNDGVAPKISRLGSNEWARTKQKARQAVREMTDELIDLYAKRKQEGGYAFSEDTVWQAEFEQAFPYEETPDQLQSIEEIKEDMEKDEPMDRLLCGDVGYGKTEVAARAIFKCLIEGKQAALLVPTTILASQHFNTLKERFNGFPFNIELMSRFKTDKELKAVAEGLKKGKVDLVIGTHRLLSQDVEFKDLGLLVVDEEQRFGVAHKEKIKTLKAGVDVLTLSATPIPRTLNMSLTGIRDMSLISEPPEERYPVQTYVVEQEEDLIREVIQREMDRNGQVFVVFNRVRGIIQVADMIRRLVPEAKVAVAHGQMSENSLEDVMGEFVDGKIDILVATTIVESGLDIPNANTLIVLDADKCGLSQLYQLRGRVGRSNRIAYAYLMYKKEKVLTEIAEKRLRAVREFTEFGAGFKIAMRDMELRGAGNILGAQQSGHMMNVGYEMYARLVDEAARMARGEEVKRKNEEVTVELKTVAGIPSWYIEEESIKLAMYKRIADIETEQDASDVIEELIDRFGDVPKETLNLIKISRIRSLSQSAFLSRLHEQNGKIYIALPTENKLSPYVVMKVNESLGDKIMFYDGREPYFTLRVDSKTKLDDTIKALETLVMGLAAKEAV